MATQGIVVQRGQGPVSETSPGACALTPRGLGSMSERERADVLQLYGREIIGASPL